MSSVKGKRDMPTNFNGYHGKSRPCPLHFCKGSFRPDSVLLYGKLLRVAHGGPSWCISRIPAAEGQFASRIAAASRNHASIKDLLCQIAFAEMAILLLLGWLRVKSMPQFRLEDPWGNAGRRQLKAEADRWAKMTNVVSPTFSLRRRGKYERDRVVVTRSRVLCVEGPLQNQPGVIDAKAQRIAPLDITSASIRSHDFH